MEGLMNVGSLVLGLIAWILPVVNLAQHNKISSKRYAAFTVTSLSFCAAALYLQLFYTDHLKNRRLVCASGYFPCDGIGCHTTSCGYDCSQHERITCVLQKKRNEN